MSRAMLLLPQPAFMEWRTQIYILFCQWYSSPSGTFCLQRWEHILVATQFKSNFRWKLLWHYYW